MTALLALIQTFLGGIPIIGTFLSTGLGGIISKFFDSKTAIETARINSAATVATATMQTRVTGLGVVAGSTLLTILVIAFASPLVVFEWKVIVWDTVLQWGSTAAIHGQVADWANSIIWAIFGSAGTAAVLGIWKSKG